MTVLTVLTCVVAQAGLSAPAASNQTGPLIVEAVVPASAAEVWQAFTTKEGLEAWMVAHAEIDLRVGGKMLTHYNPDGRIGDPNTIENTILSYDPQRMLSIKATRPPANFPLKAAIESMWSVIYFEELSPGRTHVRCVGLGYGTDEDSQKLRSFFEQGNRLTLQRLKAHFVERAGGDANDGDRGRPASRHARPHGFRPSKTGKMPEKRHPAGPADEK